MRNLQKLDCPDILRDNHEKWLEELAEDPTNSTRKSRYRAKPIKDQVKSETGGKCIYCESFIGHNTPGDIEHIHPVKHFPEERFVWENLSLACTECNRRKSDYTHAVYPFLNPYSDDVEKAVTHLGPIVTWEVGNQRAEITIKKLEINSHGRKELVFRKIEALAEFDNLLERFASEKNEVVREILRLELLSKADIHAEYSGMMKSIIEQNMKVIGV